MILSLNEIESMGWKAARGAGLAWGLAEEMAQAARWLADHGFDWAEPLVAALADAEQREGRLPPPFLSDDGAWDAALGEAEVSPILCGPLMTDIASDLGSSRPLVFRSVAYPVLMLPFAAGAAAAFGFGLALKIDQEDFWFDGAGAAGTSRLAGVLRAGKIVLSMPDQPAAREVPTFAAGAPRRAIAPDLLARLEAWVHRTYVPASAQSRLAGAGAGLTDND
ncbi:MAG TPA: DUF3726 domain-containing protein [Candidatus Cybelea sp.]|nr:DUF3726 domain-containing protein [Candidatus Cybelea sp.]